MMADRGICLVPTLAAGDAIVQLQRSAAWVDCVCEHRSCGSIGSSQLYPRSRSRGETAYDA